MEIAYSNWVVQTNESLKLEKSFLPNTSSQTHIAEYPTPLANIGKSHSSASSPNQPVSRVVWGLGLLSLKGVTRRPFRKVPLELPSGDNSH